MKLVSHAMLATQQMAAQAILQQHVNEMEPGISTSAKACSIPTDDHFCFFSYNYVLFFLLHIPHCLLPSVPFSAITCTPLYVAHSSANNKYGVYGDSVIVECNVGYEVTGGGRSFTAQCNEQGVWTNVLHCQSRYFSRKYIVVKSFSQIDKQTNISK